MVKCYTLPVLAGMQKLVTYDIYGGYGEVVNTADCGSVTLGFESLYSPHRGIAKW